MFIKKIAKQFFITALFIGGAMFTSTGEAEIKTYEGIGEYVMSDFETPDVAKQRAKVRAERDAQEKAGVFVSGYTKVKNLQVTDGIMSVTNTTYDTMTDSGSFVFRAKIKANIDTDEINNWLKLNLQEREMLTTRNDELQKALAEQDKKIAELKQQLNGKNTSADIVKIKTEFANMDNEFLSNQKIESGNKFYFNGDYNSAISDYTKAIELNENNAIAYRNRGTAYANVKDYRNAVEDFSKVIEFNPNNSSAYIGRGAAYIYLREYNRAVVDLNRAINLDPNSAIAYYNRGICYKALKNNTQAREDFSRSRNLGYTP